MVDGLYKTALEFLILVDVLLNATLSIKIFVGNSGSNFRGQVHEVGAVDGRLVMAQTVEESTKTGYGVMRVHVVVNHGILKFAVNRDSGDSGYLRTRSNC